MKNLKQLLYIIFKKLDFTRYLRNANFTLDCNKAFKKAIDSGANCDPSNTEETNSISVKLNNTIASSFDNRFYQGWDYHYTTTIDITSASTTDVYSITLVSPLLDDSNFRLGALVFLYDRLDDGLEIGAPVDVAVKFHVMHRNSDVVSWFQSETTSYDRKNYTSRVMNFAGSGPEEGIPYSAITLIATQTM